MAQDDTDRDPFSDKAFDQFWLNNVFPDASTLFGVNQKPIQEIKDSCLVALDANVLLLPYEMGAESFSKVADVYRSLCAQDRLYVPAQAAREFVKNRASKLRDLVKQIGDQAGTLNFSFHREIGFLEKDPAFVAIKKESEVISSSRTKLLSEVKALRASLTDNIGSDPVSMVYKDLLSERVISLPDGEGDRAKLLDEMKWRYRHKVPPGYKDASKDDGGIGDFLIWKAILEQGKAKMSDCLFVTKDLKGDWWVQGQGAFQPRIELIEEYFRFTGGHTIHFASLSNVLETFDVEDATVIDVKRVEAHSVQQALQAELKPVEVGNAPQSSLFETGDTLSSMSLAELIRAKNDAEAEVMRLIHDSRPLRRKLESPDLVDALDEASILDLYQQEQKQRSKRSRLRMHAHRITQEIGRRSSLQDEE